MNEFEEIALENGTDKVTVHSFGPVYHEALGPLRTLDGVTLLEIGVDKGYSLKAWAEYLPRATVYGIDNDPKCIKDYGERIHVSLVDVMAKEFRAYAEALPPLDVVIDDGGHWPDQQRMAFSVLWAKLKPGGLFFIEDLNVRRKGPFNSDLGEMAAQMLYNIDEALPTGMHFYPELCVLEK